MDIARFLGVEKSIDVGDILINMPITGGCRPSGGLAG